MRFKHNPSMKVLVIDVGGTHVKLLASGEHGTAQVQLGRWVHAGAAGRRRAPDRGRDGRSTRRRIGISQPGAARRRDGRAVEPRPRLGGLRLRRRAGRAGPHHQRRGHAGPRQLRRRPHAVPGTGLRPRHGAHRRRPHRPARTGAPPVSRLDLRGHLRPARPAPAGRRRVAGRRPRRGRAAAGGGGGRVRGAGRRQRPATSATCRRASVEAATTTPSRAASASGPTSRRCPLPGRRCWRTPRFGASRPRRRRSCRCSTPPIARPRFTLRLDDLLVDYSKNRVTDETMAACRTSRGPPASRLARPHVRGREDQRHRGPRGPARRAAQPLAAGPILVDGRGRHARRAARCSPRCAPSPSASAAAPGAAHTGETITDVVNIGIGGSDLGPVMVSEALKPYQRPDLRVHFVSNVDGTHLAETLARLDPRRTLFIVASKTFTTQETMTNAQTRPRLAARQALGEATRSRKHFVAVSTNAKEVARFGIDAGEHVRVLGLGRRPLLAVVARSACRSRSPSASSASRSCSTARTRWTSTSAPRRSSRTCPVILALLGVWYRNFLGATRTRSCPTTSTCTASPPTSSRCDMESNGKSVRPRRQRGRLRRPGPIVWGEPGTNGQHAFYQLHPPGHATRPVRLPRAAETPTRLGDHHECCSPTSSRRPRR